MSDVVELIVCNQDGVFTGVQKGKIAPDSGDDENIYTFYAVKDGSTKKDIKKVQLTMPIGGELNGVLRLPKIGERILVIVQGNSYYLMSYLPNKADMEFRKDKNEKEAVKNESLTLRYKSPNEYKGKSKTKKNEKFSELKFSTTKTFWKNKKVENGEKTEFLEDSFPKVDRVDLTSTGDLFSTATNYNEINARRIGIFSDVDVSETIVTEEENGKSIEKIKINPPSKDEKDKKEDLSDDKNIKNKNQFSFLPFDKMDDKSAFDPGDIQVRAGNKIVLKAKKGIEIQCGRSLIKIDDSGVKIISSKVDPTYPTLCDSSLSVTSQKGVTATGNDIKLSANLRFNISEGMGGSISSYAGSMTAKCHDISVGTTKQSKYISTYAKFIRNFVEDIPSMHSGWYALNRPKEEHGDLENWNVAKKYINSLWDGVDNFIFSRMDYHEDQEKRNAGENVESPGRHDSVKMVLSYVLKVKDMVLGLMEKMGACKDKSVISTIDFYFENVCLGILAGFLISPFKDPSGDFDSAKLLKGSKLSLFGPKIELKGSSVSGFATNFETSVSPIAGFDKINVEKAQMWTDGGVDLVKIALDGIVDYKKSQPKGEKEL